MNMYDAYAVVTSSPSCVEGDVELMAEKKEKRKPQAEEQGLYRDKIVTRDELVGGEDKLVRGSPRVWRAPLSGCAIHCRSGGRRWLK
jgi:hypothetical protein